MAFRAASAGLLPTAPCSSGRPVKSVAPPPPFGAAPRSRLHGRALFRFQGKLRLEARSIPVSGPQGSSEGCGGDSGGSDGQVTAALIDSMRAKISEALETTDVNIVDVYGDGRHVSIDVVSNVFEGKNSMERQRMVFKAIWFELQDTVHAVDSMTTKTPAEASS